MGLMDSLKGALGGDHEDALDAPGVQVPVGMARHVDRDAPPERMEDATLVTGGKHRA